MFLVAVCWQFLTYNGFANDHYFHVARARQMLLGDMPVRDFVDVGAPLQYVVSAAARWLFGDVAGPELLVVAIGVAIGAAATAICASWLARSVIVGAAVTLLEILASPRTYSYPKMLLYGLAGCVIVAVVARVARGRILAAAGLTAASFLMRHDHGLFIGAACAAAIALSAPALADATKRLALFAVAVAVLLVPWAAWVQYHQGLPEYFTLGVAVSRREADLSLLREFPALQLADGLTTANVHAWLYYVFWTVAVVSVMLALWRRFTTREQWPGESVAVVGISVFALALDASFLRNPLETRLADATVPAALLGAWLLGLAWHARARLPVVVVIRAVAAGILVITSIAIWRLGDVTEKLDEIGVFDDLDHVQAHTRTLVRTLTEPEMNARKLPSRVSAGLVPFFHYLQRCTASTDRLLVSGPYPDVFVLGRRGFAGGHMSFMEAFFTSDADQALTLARMRRESVPFVVLPLDDQVTFARNFPKLWAHVESAYEPLADMPAEELTGIRIMVERSRPRRGVDTATGWPCFTPPAGVA
jgi:MFS family permease